MFSTAGLARVSARRPWFVVAVWVVLLVLAGVAATGLGDAFTTEADFTNQPESVRADDLLEAAAARRPGPAADRNGHRPLRDA